MNPKRQTLLDTASAEVGYEETPVNVTKYGEWFGLNGEQWCMIFFCWVYWKAGLSLGRGDFAKGWASVPNFLQHAYDNQLVTTEPQPGDAVIFDWNKQNPGHVEGRWTPRHVEMFEGWINRHEGTFTTYGGNTSPLDKSNGGMVQHETRSMQYVQAFVSPLSLEP